MLNQNIILEEELNNVRIVECGEKLIGLNNIEGVIIEMTDARRRFPNETLFARKSVIEKLENVAREIFPYRLKVYDAFRPIEIQQQWFDEVYNSVREKHPELSEKEVRDETFICVFPPSWNLQRPPPHSTGAAIDITITNSAGQELDMGTRYAEFDNPLMYTNASGLNRDQKNNRGFLIENMVKSGFVNFPGEWWHFSFGDREWIAYNELNGPAKYSRVTDPYK